jgi:hemolysin III
MDDGIAQRHPFSLSRAYSRAELIADGIVHGVGIFIAIAAGSVLLAVSAYFAAPAEYAATVFFVISLLAALSISCAYNLWPPSPLKWRLRRLDHAAIYLLIAGTYTPFLFQLEDPVVARLMTAIVWGGALCGIALKLLLPGLFDRLAVLFYLAIGWSGVVMIHSLGAILPASTIWFVVSGGVVYSLGVIFHVWRKLRFQNALWHGFVVAGAALHLAAVTDLMVLTRL